jgi:hypothetical protein
VIRNTLSNSLFSRIGVEENNPLGSQALPDDVESWKSDKISVAGYHPRPLLLHVIYQAVDKLCKQPQRPLPNHPQCRSHCAQAAAGCNKSGTEEGMQILPAGRM